MPRFLCCAAFAGSLMAQQFELATARAPAEIPPGTWSMLAFGDCDGDGDQDLAANPETGSFSILRQGPGKTWTTIPVLPNVVTAAVWVDFDGDGDRDVLVAASNVWVGVPYGIVRNDGATFTWCGQQTSLLLGTATRCFAADLNGDQLPDDVLGTTAGVEVGRNLGNNVIGFPAVVTTLPNARPDLLDHDGDGDLDLVVASTAGVRLFDNVAGTFTQVAAFSATGTDVAARDFDADGRVDMALVNGGAVDVVWNRPTGWVHAAAVVPAGPTIHLLLSGDLDRDLDPDLVVRTSADVDWVRNDGNGAFTRLAGVDHGASWPLRTVALGDGASRGAVDVVTVFYDEAVRTMYGAAPEPFLDPQALPVLPYRPGELTLGDVDGDGRVDCVAPRAREVVIDTGRGRFERRPIVGAQEHCNRAVLGDFDGDGDLDLVLGTTSQAIPPVPPLQRLENDGQGNFTPVQDVPVGGHFQVYRTGDADGDGDLDIVMPHPNGQVVVLLNTGGGNLVDVGTIASVPPYGYANDLVYEDLDGDGDRDIVSGQFQGTMPVRYDTGGGVFVAAGALALTPGAVPAGLHPGDLDGDGDTDIVVNESGALVWFRNQGPGNWQRMNGSFPPGGAYWVVSLVDVDEDGDLDVWSNGSGPRVLVNDGAGTFTDPGSLSTIAQPSGAKFLDFDEDGDLDLIAAHGDVVERVVNRTRGAESVHAPQPGGSMEVRFFVQPQAPDPQALVIALASLGPGPSLASPGLRGRLLLPLGGLVPLSLLSLGSGTATTGFAIPPLASLIGTEICMQGIVVTSTGLAFTNVVDERVLP